MFYFEIRKQARLSYRVDVRHTAKKDLILFTAFICGLKKDESKKEGLRQFQLYAKHNPEKLIEAIME